VWSERYYWDYDFNDRVSDDERDEDADGLTNFDEFAGAMTAALWKGCYQRETSFPILYSGTSMVDADSDGDDILDGADDQDFDDVPNIMEISRSMASGRPWANPLPCDSKNAVADPTPAEGFVQPFNPCLPDRKSRTCLLHPIIDRPFPPFDPSYTNYLVLN
jgi:hypothetical protein